MILSKQSHSAIHIFNVIKLLVQNVWTFILSHLSLLALEMIVSLLFVSALFHKVGLNGTFVSVNLHARPDRWQHAQTDSWIQNQICFLISQLSRIDLDFKISSGKQSNLKKQFVILSPNHEISFLVLRMEQFSIRSFTDLISILFSSGSTLSPKKPISNTVLTHTSNAIQKLCKTSISTSLQVYAC